MTTNNSKCPILYRLQTLHVCFGDETPRSSSLAEYNLYNNNFAFKGRDDLSKGLIENKDLRALLHYAASSLVYDLG